MHSTYACAPPPVAGHSSARTDVADTPSAHCDPAGPSAAGVSVDHSWLGLGLELEFGLGCKGEAQLVTWPLRRASAVWSLGCSAEARKISAVQMR